MQFTCPPTEVDSAPALHPSSDKTKVIAIVVSVCFLQLSMQTRQRTNTVSEELVSFSIFAGKTFVHARACVEDPRFLYFLGVILLIVYFRLSSLCCDKLTFGRQGKSSLSRASSGDTLHYMLHDSASTTPHHRLQFRTDKPLRPQGEVKTQAIALQNLDHL